MSFDPSTIVGPIVTPDGAALIVSWTSSLPAGTAFQVYRDYRLVRSTYFRRVHLSSFGGRSVFHVGAISAGDWATDFSSSLAAVGGSGSRANLKWQGGAYLGQSLAGFHVYAGLGPGTSVNWANRVGDVPAYPGGIVIDGAGVGGAGDGVAGSAAMTYSWRSGPLAPGVWQFAVVPVSASGVEGASTIFSVTIATPPLAPTPFADGSRLKYSYNATTRQATLWWNAPASPPTTTSGVSSPLSGED